MYVGWQLRKLGYKIIVLNIVIQLTITQYFFINDLFYIVPCIGMQFQSVLFYQDIKYTHMELKTTGVLYYTLYLNMFKYFVGGSLSPLSEQLLH